MFLLEQHYTKCCMTLVMWIYWCVCTHIIKWMIQLRDTLGDYAHGPSNSLVCNQNILYSLHWSNKFAWFSWWPCFWDRIKIKQCFICLLHMIVTVMKGVSTNLFQSDFDELEIVMQGQQKLCFNRWYKY